MDCDVSESVLRSHRRDDRAVACVDIFLVNCEVGVLLRPLTLAHRPLREVDLVEVNDLFILSLQPLQLRQKVLAALLKVLPYMWRQVLLLSHFLSLNAVLQVKLA